MLARYHNGVSSTRSAPPNVLPTMSVVEPHPAHVVVSEILPASTNAGPVPSPVECATPPSKNANGGRVSASGKGFGRGGAWIGFISPNPLRHLLAYPY